MKAPASTEPSTPSLPGAGSSGQRQPRFRRHLQVCSQNQQTSRCCPALAAGRCFAPGWAESVHHGLPPRRRGRHPSSLGGKAPPPGGGSRGQWLPTCVQCSSLQKQWPACQHLPRQEHLRASQASFTPRGTDPAEAHLVHRKAEPGANEPGAQTGQSPTCALLLGSRTWRKLAGEPWARLCQGPAAHRHAGLRAGASTAARHPLNPGLPTASPASRLPAGTLGPRATAGNLHGSPGPSPRHPLKPALPPAQRLAGPGHIGFAPEQLVCAEEARHQPVPRQVTS